MKLQMHSIHFDADRKLIDFIQKKKRTNWTPTMTESSMGSFYEN